MKKTAILFILLLVSVAVKPQTNSIEQVLKSVEANNRELKASQQLTVSRKLEAKSENNLSDPSVSYSYQFGSPSSIGKSTELNVLQEFDFPTLYSRRSELNRLKGNTFDRQDGSMRRQILLSAKEVCLDLILLNKKKVILDEWIKLGNELSALYKRRLELGDANALEAGKINMEILNIKTGCMLNEAQRQTKLEELRSLNGNIAIEFNDTTYLSVEDIIDFALLKQEALAGDTELLLLEGEQKLARQQLAVNKSQWLPKLELGYRLNTGLGEKFNGVIVGFSVPLFENKSKVKQAKVQSVYVDMKKESAVLQAESRLLRLYKEAQLIKTSMKEFDQAVAVNTMLLLNEALRKQQISTIDYCVDANTVFQNQLNYMELENRYQKVMAQLYQHRL